MDMLIYHLDEWRRTQPAGTHIVLDADLTAPMFDYFYPALSDFYVAGGPPSVMVGNNCMALLLPVEKESRLAREVASIPALPQSKVHPRHDGRVIIMTGFDNANNFRKMEYRLVELTAGRVPTFSVSGEGRIPSILDAPDDDWHRAEKLFRTKGTPDPKLSRLVRDFFEHQQ